MHKDGGKFLYLRNKFPRINEANIKDSTVLLWPINKDMEDTNFDYRLNAIEKAAWNVFREVKTISLAMLKLTVILNL